MRHLLLPLLLLGACAKERETAPATLDDLAHSMYTNWEEGYALGVALAGAADWLDTDGDSDEAWEGLRLTNLGPAELADVDVPEGTDLTLHVGIATAAPSAFSTADHAELMVEADQTWTDPATFEVYERTTFEGNDAAFAAGSGLVRTENVCLKTGPLGVRIPYEMRKDYRWIALDDGRSAVIGRNWVSEPGCSDNGNNCVLQVFGLDIFIDAEPGSDTSLRLYATWLEVRTAVDGLLSEESRIGLIATGNQDIFEATEDELIRRAEEGSGR